MGNLFSSHSRQCRILIVGLDGSGQTSILFKLAGVEVFSSSVFGISTIFKSFEYKGLQLNVWDVARHDRIRALFRHYFANVIGLIFVLDCGDHSRLQKAKQLLDSLLSEDELRDAPLLIYANKQDLSNALSVKDVAELFQLIPQCIEGNGRGKVSLQGVVNGRQWRIQSSTCFPKSPEGGEAKVIGDTSNFETKDETGLWDGLDWFVERLRS